MEGQPKNASRFEKGLRGALAGAAFLGAVGGAEVPKEGGPLQMQSAEAHESFDANKEADAFLRFVASLSESSRVMQSAQIEEGFDMFALALANKTAHYSTNSQPPLRGHINGQVREVARTFLLPRALALHSNNPAVQFLISGFLSDSMEGPPDDVRKALTGQ